MLVLGRHQMSPADAAWLHMDRPTNLMVINSVLWFDEAVDWEAVRRVFMERVAGEFPRFRQRVGEGLPGLPPAWCDDADFEPDLHFHRLALPAPGDKASLEAVVSDLVSTPLDRSRPLWDVYLLEGYGEGSAILVRMHHAIADGIALARVMLSMTDSSRGAASFVATSGNGHLGGPIDVARSAIRGGMREAARTVAQPARVLDAAAMVVRDARSLAKLLLPGWDTPSPLKGDLSVAHRVAWSDPVSLSSVKRTGRLTGTTVNDVLVAAVAGAVRAHLGDGGRHLHELHALVPFNLRPLDEPLPRDLGNRFGLLLVTLPVGVADPLERLHAVHEQMEAIKRSHEGAIAYGILGIIGRTPALLEARLVDYFSAKGSMVLTNVPGPRRTVTLAGTPVRGVLVWAPCSGSLGMSVSIFSYAGRVTVGFLADAARVEDPDRLAGAFRREVLALGRAARRAAAPDHGR